MELRWIAFALIFGAATLFAGTSWSQGDPAKVVDLRDRAFTADDVVRALAAPPDSVGGAPVARKKRGLAVMKSGDDAAVDAAASRPRRTISMQLQFEFDSARLTEDALARLNAVGSALQAPELRTGKFQVSGHTDAAGRYDYNLQLSKRRADAVRTYLMVRHGVDGERIVAIGKASDELIDPADARSAANRRVQFEALD